MRESSGASNSRLAWPSLSMAQIVSFDAMKTRAAAPRGIKSWLIETGVATLTGVANACGVAGNEATVGVREGLGSLANCGPEVSSAQATKNKQLHTAAKSTGDSFLD
jgi:hypothetical protein